MQSTRLEKLRQSLVVVVVVVVVVGAYFPVTGNHARRLRGSTPHGDVGLRNPVVAHTGPPSCCSQHRDRRKSPVSDDAPPSHGGDAPPDKGSATAPGKGSAGDKAPGEGAAGVSKYLLVRSRIWSTKPSTCGSTDTPLAFSWLAGMLAVKSKTPV